MPCILQKISIGENMKKLSKILMLFSVFILSSIALVACGENKIDTMVLKTGTLETTIERGETLDTSNAVVIVTYKDETRVEVDATRLSFGSIDTQTVGNKSLSISYTDENEQSKTIYITIKVVATEADILSVTRLESNLLADFSTNRINTASENVTFADQEQPLYVGDDNAFNFRIVAGGFDGLDNFVEVEKVRTNITVSVLEGSSFVELQDDDIAYYVSVDTENTVLDFTENAIGHTFKVDVRANNIDETAQMDDVSFSAELVVVDAYNVYTAKQLSVFHNKDNSYSDIWAEIGLTYDEVKEIKGVILQDNIVITKDDVRQKKANGEDLFWTESTTNYSTARGYTTEELLGTPIDDSSTGIYDREIHSGDQFEFIGNYFTVDLSSFPKMVVESDGSKAENAVKVENKDQGIDAQYMTSHLCVFYVWAGENTIKTETQVNWSNIAFAGNVTLDNDPRNSGGILLMKNTRTNFHAYNTLTNNFYIGYFMQLGMEENAGVENEYMGQYVIEKSKGYNFYQCCFYGWGAKDVMFLDCEYKRAGGPAIIADHIKQENNDPDTGYPTHINIVQSTIESVVTAQSPWFVIYGASETVSQITALDMLFNGAVGLPKSGTIFADTITEDSTTYQQLNLVAVLKNDDQGLSVSNIRSTVNIFKTLDDFQKYYGLGDYTTADKSSNYGLDMGSGVADLSRKGSHYVQDSETGTFMKGAATDITDGDMYKLTVMAQVLNGVIDEIVKQNAGLGTYLTPLKIDETAFATLSMAEKRTTLQQTVTAFGQVATTVYAQTGQTTNLMLYIPQGMTTATIFEAIDGYNGMSIDQQVTALNAEIETYKDLPIGEYINLYTALGIGVVLGFYPSTAA